MTMFTIRINFEQDGLEAVTLENIEPGQSLLEICLKNDIALHHNCGGVCACRTCHLYLNSGEEHLEEVSKREKDFIDRAMNSKLNSRLGCQCLLINDKGVVEVTLPDQTKILDNKW
jgi:2Fe-2S ferredoxin